MSKIDDWIKAALRKCGGGHKKRHSVNRERSRETSARVRKLKQKVTAKTDAFVAYKHDVAAFYRGERDTLPPKPKL